MPELPEVETVKRELEKVLIGKTFDTPQVYYKPLIHSPYEEYISALKGKKVTHLSRRGKFLLLHLDNDHKLIFHLRMEGKLFVVKEEHSLSHLSMYIPFLEEEGGLAFYDVRKFGVTYYCKEEDDSVFAHLGPEPFEIEDDLYLFAHYHNSNKHIKELLLDQSIMSGLGNIYADEVLFRSHISPFKRGKKLTREDCDTILEQSKKVLTLAIESNGSTIRTYWASENVHGNFQDFLRVYGRQGLACQECKTHKIEKKMISSRSTSYCPHCQNTGYSVAITGKIASGKSLVLSYFARCGFLTFSCDEEVHRLYKDEKFLEELKKNFPQVFTPTLDKALITSLLQNDKAFKKKYEHFIFQRVKKSVDDFLIEHDGEDKAVEVPLLFDAHMQDMFSYTCGVETTKQEEHLKSRGEEKSRKAFNQINSYDEHRKELDFILNNDSGKDELLSQVKQVVSAIHKNKIY